MLSSLHVDMAKLCSLSYLNQNKIQENFTQSINIKDSQDNENNYTQNKINQVLQKCNKCPQLITGNYDAEAIITSYYCKDKTQSLDILSPNDEYLSIVFRGTESKTDILTDLNIFQVPLELPMEYYEYEKLPLVHQGFYQQFTSLKAQVKNHIEKYYQEKNHNIRSNYAVHKKIIFTGHSLGGALATISALYFSYLYPDLMIYCITLGSPRVGDTQFVKLFNQRIPHSYRYVNDNDPVPCLPTPWRFQHVKGLRWLHEDQIKKEIMVWRFYRFCKNTLLDWFGYGYNPLQDHSCLEYIHDLHSLHSNL